VKVISKISEIRSTIKKQKSDGKRIGLVPTMGFLHEGHLSLVRGSLRRTDCTVVSIYVNPRQFGPEEDFQEYPRDLEKDKAMLKGLGVDFVFIPDHLEMYPEGFKTFVEVKELQDKYEGQSRPGHFRGVCTVVLKLFAIIQPDVSFFGQKDAQQAVIIKKMVQDLNVDVEIQVLPTVREKDGLALSSRNVYLTEAQRKAALCLANSLRKAKNMIDAGETDPQVVASEMRKIIDQQELAKLDYIAIVDLDNFEPLAKIEKDALIAVAAFFGKVRLLDNIIVGIKSKNNPS
jgi:pantoate--beta-alanine ligase